MAAPSTAQRRRETRRPPPRFLSGIYTNQGHRQRNEDAAACYTVDDDELLAVVADGMGGGLDGKRFSDSAVDRLQATFISSAARDGGARLDEAVRAAIAALSELRQSDPRYGGSGSTIVAAHVVARPDGVEARFLNVGDSPLYHVHATTRTAEQLSADHTYAEALVRAGTPREDAVRHVQGEQLTHVLGATLDPATVPGYNPQRVIALRPNDRLVLCSDGVSKHTSLRELADLALTGPPEEAARQLAQRALRNGSKDNLTALVVQCRPERRGPSPVVLAVLALMLLVGLVAAVAVTAQSFRVATPPPPTLAVPLATVTPLPTGTVEPTPTATPGQAATATPAPSVEPSLTPTYTPTTTPSPTRTPAPPTVTVVSTDTVLTVGTPFTETPLQTSTPATELSPESITSVTATPSASITPATEAPIATVTLTPEP